MSSSKSTSNNNNNSNDSDDLSDFEEEDEGDYEDDEDEEEQLGRGGGGGNASDEEDDDLDNADELRLLAEEGEMSVEELRRKYLGGDDFALDSGSPSSSNHSHELAPQPGCSTATVLPSASTSTDKYGYFALKTSAIYEGAEDEEEDEEYAPPEFWKKSARVGPEFQANQLPKVTSISQEASHGSSSTSSTSTTQYRPHPAEPMWIPSLQICPLAGIAQSQDPAEVFDDENALYALLNNNYSVVKAKAEGPFPWPSLQCVNGPRRTYTEPWRPFSEEDCAEFESALRIYGKNFWAIKKDKMSDRKRNKQAHQTQRSAIDSVNTTDFMGGIMDMLNGGNGNDLAYSTQIELEASTTSSVRSQVSNSLGTNIPSSPMNSSKGWLHVGGNATPTSSTNKGQ
uniref:ELM2 domain-containing protein n=1 Tax=Ditylenchus dipsaci TaxID=166011 RepID=A0A915D0G1_9BILA